jgi:pimeloyl-ACP methyl ester carboxylesterase
MAAHVRGLVDRGVNAHAIDLPLKKAEAAVEALRAIVPDGPNAPGAGGNAIAVGGQSYGGRVASLAAAEPDTDYAALVLFSYPLHAPGRPIGRPSAAPSCCSPATRIRSPGSSSSELPCRSFAMPSS